MFHEAIEDETLLRMASQMFLRKDGHMLYYRFFRGPRPEPVPQEVVDRARRLADREDVRVSLVFFTSKTGSRVEVARMTKYAFYIKLLLSFDHCLKKVSDVREIPDSIVCALASSCVVDIHKVVRKIHTYARPTWLSRYVATDILSVWKVDQMHTYNQLLERSDDISSIQRRLSGTVPMPIDIRGSVVCFDLKGESDISIDEIPEHRRIHPYRMSMATAMMVSEFLYLLNRSNLVDSDVVRCNWCVSNRIQLLLPAALRSMVDLLEASEFKVAVMALYQRITAICCGNRSMDYLIDQTRLPCLSCDFVRSMVTCVACTVTGEYQFDETIKSIRAIYGRLWVTVKREKAGGRGTEPVFVFPIESHWCAALKCFYQCELLLRLQHSRSTWMDDQESWTRCKLIPVTNAFVFPGKTSLTRSVEKKEDADAKGFTIICQYSNWTKMLRSFAAIDFVSCNNSFSKLRLLNEKTEAIDDVHLFTVDMKYFKHLVFTRRVLDVMNRSRISALSFGAPMDLKDNMRIDDASAELVNFEGYVDKALSPAANKIDGSDPLHLVKSAYSSTLMTGSSHATNYGCKLFPSSVTTLGVDHGYSDSLKLTYTMEGQTLKMLQNVLPIRSCGRVDQWADGEIMPYPGFVHFCRSFLFGDDRQLEQALLWLSDRMYKHSTKSESRLRLLPRGHAAFGCYRMLVLLVNGFTSADALFSAMQSIYKRQGMLVSKDTVRRKRRMGKKSAIPGGDHAPSTAMSVDEVDCYDNSDLQSVVSCEYYEDLDSETLLGQEDGISFSAADLFEEDEPVARISHVDLSVENLTNVRDSLIRLIEAADRLDGVKTPMPTDAQREAMLKADGGIRFSNVVRNPYNILRPFLSPYDDVFADYGMLNCVWQILLYDEQLWIDHSPLVCLLMEMMDINYECLIRDKTLIPSWQPWVYHRKRYVKACLSIHKKKRLHGPLSDKANQWCTDDKHCPYCVLVSNQNHTDTETYISMNASSFWTSDKTYRRLTGAFSAESGDPDDEEDFLRWCVNLDKDYTPNPLCNIPPRPLDDDVHEWEDALFKIKGDYSKKNPAVGESTDMMVPKELYTIPDLAIPPHFLFYIFACDPRIDSSARTGILAGLRSNRVMPHLSPCCNPTVGKSAEIFSAACSKLEEHINSQVLDVDPVMPKAQYGLDDFSSWVGHNFPPFSVNDVTDKGLPANMLMHMAFIAEAFSNLPYDADVERASRIQPLGDVCYGKGVLRSMISADSVSSMYNNVKCMTLVCDMQRELPLGYKIVLSAPQTAPAGSVVIDQNAADYKELMQHSANKDCVTYKVHTLTQSDCLPIWESPYDVVRDNNTLDRGPHHKTMTDSLLSRKFFNKQRLPKPFSMSYELLTDMAINLPMVYFDKSVMARFAALRDLSREDEVLRLAKRPAKQDIRSGVKIQCF